MTSLQIYGGTIHSLSEYCSCKGAFLSAFVANLEIVYHFVDNQNDWKMAEATNTWSQVCTDYSALRSIVKAQLNDQMSGDKSQIQPSRRGVRYIVLRKPSITGKMVFPYGTK